MINPRDDCPPIGWSPCHGTLISGHYWYTYIAKCSKRVNRVHVALYSSQILHILAFPCFYNFSYFIQVEMKNRTLIMLGLCLILIAVASGHRTSNKIKCSIRCSILFLVSKYLYIILQHNIYSRALLFLELSLLLFCKSQQLTI